MVIDLVEVVVWEVELIYSVWQLIFEGCWVGEGYFSVDGKCFVFQSECVLGNFFFQIYFMDLEIGDVKCILLGYGKIICVWIYVQGCYVFFVLIYEDVEVFQK